MRDVYIVGAVRSPIASVKRGRLSKSKVKQLAAKVTNDLKSWLEKFSGLQVKFDSPSNTSAFSGLSPQELAVLVLKSLFNQSGVQPEWVETFRMGSVISQKVEPSMMQAPAKAILRKTVSDPSKILATARTVEQACSTGLVAIAEAAEKVRLGEVEIAVAGGVDMMSRVPDSKVLCGLTDPFTGKLMAHLADEKAQKINFTREDHDQFAIESYQLAKKYLNDHGQSIVPVGLVQVDEEVTRYPFNPDKIKQMKAIGSNGIITPANASKYGDAAAFVMLASEEAVKKYNLKPLAKFVSFAEHSEKEPRDFVVAPYGAILKALRKVSDSGKIALLSQMIFEVNEAFATAPLSVMRELNVSRDRMNVWGGAIAHGHPIGATGAVLTVKLINILHKENRNYGVVSLCNAVSEATAAVIEKVPHS